MGIKKLIKNTTEVIKLTVKKDEAIIVLDISGALEFLYLQKPREDEIKKLKEFDINSYKFIGDKSLFDRIEELLEWPKAIRRVFLKEEKNVYYYADTGKIRFEKNNNFQNVLIVDDSKTIQKLLSKIIEQSQVLNIIGVASSAAQAQEIIESGVRVDLITLDIHMPHMNGVEFLKSYLGKKNIPTVMISSVSINEGPLVMEALSSGAYTYIQKPSIDKLAQVTESMLHKLEAVVKVGPKAKVFQSSQKKSLLNFNDLNGLIAIGSSTGGTQALEEIFKTLPDQIPPIVVVQHIPAVFSKALANRLNDLCQFTVKEAQDGEFIEQNTIYIAPGGKQMKLTKSAGKKMVVITDDAPVNRFKPSVDYLFNSIPSLKIEKLVGVILTGMGSDGAKGLLALKDNGAYTIAQDKDSSVVFGMPKEAIALGATQKVVALPEITNCIIQQFNTMNKKDVA
ncbi:MAG: chemotaxis-specific protein-glutamate methyltransferase CheB [Bacteriovoracaceae bacterium]|jgi:two-component system chemotaxis response regulator CheB|nr:chemotaxis-specific protein-glutamate methyltransferase CheB [Bacteriovoracaceae bacterium]